MIAVMVWSAGSVLSSQAPNVEDRLIIGYDPAVPQVAFAVSEIQKALLDNNRLAVEADLDTALKSKSSLRILFASRPSENFGRLVQELGPATESTAWQAYGEGIRDALKLQHWRLYGTAYTRQKRQPVLYNRVGWVDIPGALLKKVEQDIQIAENWQPGTIKGPVKRGADKPFRK
jgi:hypothetical protein